MFKSKKSSRFSPMIAFILLFNSIFLTANAAVPLSSTETLYPGTVGQIEVGGQSLWSVPDLEKIKAEDGAVAAMGLSGGSESSYMTASNFSISIPTNAIISGIQVEIGKAYYGDTPLVDYSVRLLNASGNLVGNDYAVTDEGWNLYPTLTKQVYGGSTDLWGLSSISVSDLTSPNFGVAFAIQNPGSSAAMTNAFVDFIRIKVYYSVDQMIPELSLVNSPITYSGTQTIAEVTSNVSGAITDIKYNGLSEIPILVGTYQITADFVPDNTTLYQTLDDSIVGDFVINQAVPNLMIDNPTVVYTGSSQPALISSSITGLIEDIQYNYTGIIPIAPGTYTVTADFTPDDSTNYISFNDEIVGTFTITAQPTLYQVTVSSNISEGGWAIGESSYAEGDLVTVSATANPSYIFVNWTEGDVIVSTLPVYTFTMGTADRSLIANFKAEVIPVPIWPKNVRLSATAITSNSVTLLLSQSVPNAEKYVIYWDNQKAEFDASSGTSFIITGLVPVKFYKFQIQAVLGGIETKNGPTKSIKTRK